MQQLHLIQFAAIVHTSPGLTEANFMFNHNTFALISTESNVNYAYNIASSICTETLTKHFLVLCIQFNIRLIMNARGMTLVFKPMGFISR